MMASIKGYRDILNFSDDLEMCESYFGLIAHGKTFFVSRFINVNEGKVVKYKLTKSEAVEIQKDWKKVGRSEWFFERWIHGKVT